MDLHGTPGSRLGRPPAEEKLVELGIRLITYDRAGYGWSDRQPGRRVVDCVGDVAAIADALGLDQFAATGGSGGGPHVLAVAARLGDRVTRAQCVVGVAPYGLDDLDFFAGMDPENVKEFGWALEGEERLVAELPREAAELQARVAQDPSKILEGFDLPEADLAVLGDPRIQAVIREETADMFAHGVWGWIDDDLAFTWPWGFELSEINVPVEVRFGADDVLVPAAHGHWLAANVPGATAVVTSGAGHMSSPEEAIEHLRRMAFGD
ncbi:MAG TPA: alpha/beta hydrolase [Acidimicrobiales bacterium]|jgi:pimeloyl-ACP methyl ester carboxylesterase